MAMDSLKLNLGAGSNPLPGYSNLDIKTGTTIDALPYDDDSVDEIRASHVLEHVSYFNTLVVLRHWFAKLKPGGVVKIAVPDFDWIVDRYQHSDEQIEQILVGGQVDADDVHRAIFNRRKLEDSLEAAGFAEISTWVPDPGDTAQHPCSLCLEARKPTIGRDYSKLPNLEMVLSVPRVGFTIPMTGMLSCAKELGCAVHLGQGAFWGQVLERLITQRLNDNPACEWILTVDYDSVFDPNTVRRLVAIAERNSLDALAPLQVKREADFSMLTVADADGKLRSSLSPAEVGCDSLPVQTAHFGCTLLRASSLRQLKHPWFYGAPNKDGMWEDGREDDDTSFWRRWAAAGFNVHVSPRVKIGHLQQLITWPDRQWRAFHQYCNDYAENGRPQHAR